MGKTLIPAQRRAWIQEYLTTHKIVRSIELSEQLHISEATVRRDLEWLEKEGVLERTHGGAILTQRMRLEPQYYHRAKVYAEEKRRIGITAASLVEPGEIVFVNSGTTTTQLIRHIQGGADVTVITNNLSASQEAGEPGFELLLLGGSFQNRSNSVAGRFAIDNLRQVYADKSFIGVDGLTLEQGCTVPSNAEAEIVRLMIERTHGPVIVLSDHSKWGVVSNFAVARVDQIDRLVTDEGLSAEVRAILTAHDVKILIAGAPEPEMA
jgi:DeoR family fructose operon transcriptional repressor